MHPNAKIYYMAENDPTTLVSTDWLAARLGDRDVRVFDASYYLPDAGRNARVEYAAGHIPGAHFFDIDDIVDKNNAVPHMAAPPEIFAHHMHTLGVDDQTQVVVYDGAGVFSAARVWWNFRLMGKTNVAVLDGGFPKWCAEGRPIDDGVPATPRAGSMTVHHRPALVRDTAQVAAAAKLGDWQIVDARSPTRFKGDAPEPRKGLRAGHIPNSKNVHYATLLNTDGTMKGAQDLRAVFEAAEINVTHPTITTCGSGVTAAILMLALTRLGNPHVALYDGSWAEWGASQSLEVERG